MADGPVTPPIVRSSTFATKDAGELARRFACAGGDPAGNLVYSRLSNPTVTALEQLLASLEGAEACVATSSGMGAIHVALMAHLRPGARVVADPCVYGCTHTLLDKLAKWGVEVVRVDTSDPVALEKAVGRRTDVLFVETPMNPTLRLVDLRHAAHTVHAAGGLLVVDNTFCTPAAQKPLEHGADLVVHSLTKGINGHSDVLGGAVLGSRKLLEPVWEWRKDAGPVMDAEQAYQVWRGAQTLGVRVGASHATALAIAEHLESEGHAVRHPLLASHPQQALALRQMPKGCSVLTLDLGSVDAAHAFLDRLRIVRRAVSLGGVESLASHPWTTTHAALPEDARRRAGITPGLVRMSFGVEPFPQLLEDVLGALQRRPVARPPQALARDAMVRAQR
ncbi:MAG TPA: aminotransferase class I/II-fold pyridoxal phosphate-dependent enzyme [Candidatus Thermoplasmatota archaeon]|nr:aminotransferase class I/II-fold pyridoxal phosphate-dependent enzyme [Candidatus Thermoplasmatota archaeon]